MYHRVAKWVSGAVALRSPTNHLSHRTVTVERTHFNIVMVSIRTIVMSFQCRVWALSAEVNVTSCKFTTYTGSQIIAEFLSRLLCYCFPGDIPDWFTSFVRAQPSLKNCRFCLIQYFPEVRALKIVFTLSSKMLKSLAMYTGYLLFKTRKPSCMFDRMITGDDISAHVKRCKPSKKLFEFSRKWTPKLNPSLH